MSNRKLVQHARNTPRCCTTFGFHFLTRRIAKISRTVRLNTGPTRNARDERKKVRNKHNGRNGRNARMEAVSILALLPLPALRWMETRLNARPSYKSVHITERLNAVGDACRRTSPTNRDAIISVPPHARNRSHLHRRNGLSGRGETSAT